MDYLSKVGAPSVAPSRVRGLKPVAAFGASGASRRTLTGAWIETFNLPACLHTSIVAPSRVRGLKQLNIVVPFLSKMSHPHGCVD